MPHTGNITIRDKYFQPHKTAIINVYFYDTKQCDLYVMNFRWNAEIQEGIYAMLEMLVDLVTTRLERDPVPCGLLNRLALVSQNNIRIRQHFLTKHITGKRGLSIILFLIFLLIL